MVVEIKKKKKASPSAGTLEEAASHKHSLCDYNNERTRVLISSVDCVGFVDQLVC